MNRPPTFHPASSLKGHALGRAFGARLAMGLLIAIVIATALAGSAVEMPGVSITRGSLNAQGDANGLPVYRLPDVAVVASRKTELAKMEQEQRAAQAEQVRLKTATRPPA